KGFRVAICDQVEDPRKAKGIVKREVTRVVSPGTLTDAGDLDAREPAFIMALAEARASSGRAKADGSPEGSPSGVANTIGVALLDLSTGDFSAAEYEGGDGLQALIDELALIRPREIVAAQPDNGS